MPLFTQAGRPLRVTTELGEDGLLLSRFTGREAMSTPYVYTLDLLSEDRQIDPARMLRSRVTLHIDLPGGGERQVHGIVRRFVRQDRGEQLNAYHAEIVPWLWFLSLSHDCRIFQNVTVPEIIQTVFGDLGYTDYENRCTATYKKREYCVMYRESHLDFVSRLMEEEGIYYYFEHDQRKHTLVLVDAPVNLKEVPGSVDAHMAGQGAPHEDLVLGLQEEHSVYIAKVALKSNDYLQPSLSLYETVSGESPGKEEVFDYPGKYTDTETGQRYARLRLGAAEARRHVVRGHGTMRSFIAGHKFDLLDHHILDANQTYVLLEVQHAGSVGDFIAGAAGAARAEYSNQFVALPYRIPYVPQPVTVRPIVRGSQTATVVGPSGEEIHTDKHGRVKVQFYWDRQGKKDEKSSCWVRVSSGWAGKGWGAVSLPRIGQEVIIDFLEGDPDRPIITGRVYNAEQVPPYTLPGNQTQSGIKSRSSKGGGTENYNEIRFEDLKGQELVYIHAEKNEQHVVEADRAKSIGNDEKTTVGHDRTEEVKNNETITIGVDRTEKVGSNEKIEIGADREEKVGSNETVTIGADRTVGVGGKEELTVGSQRKTDVGSADELTVGTSLKVDAGTDVEVKAGTGMKLQASTSIELKVGASKITISPAGIELKAPKITVQGMAMVEVKAPIIQQKADGMLQVKGAIAQVNGDGVLVLKGAITMIN